MAIIIQMTVCTHLSAQSNLVCQVCSILSHQNEQLLNGATPVSDSYREVSKER